MWVVLFTRLSTRGKYGGLKESTSPAFAISRRQVGPWRGSCRSWVSARVYTWKETGLGLLYRLNILLLIFPLANEDSLDLALSSCRPGDWKSLGQVRHGYLRSFSRFRQYPTYMERHIPLQFQWRGTEGDTGGRRRSIAAYSVLA